MKYLALFFLAATVAYGQNMALRPGAEIQFLETTGPHYVGLKGPGSVSASFVWTLPATDGTAGQALLTNGSGTFYWGAGGSGGALADGDYGDFTVSGGGTVATIDDGIQIDDLTTNDDAFAVGWNGSLEVATKNSLYDKIVTLADPNTAVAWFDNIRQTFNPGALQPGFNVGSYAGDPSSPINGDLWYDSVANELTARINGASVALGAGGGGSSLTDTYVGYGDGSNALTGEAAFHYNATTNLLTVPGVSTPSLTATSASTRDFFIQDSGDDDYLKIDISNDLAAARTLTLTVPDADTTLVVPGSMTLAGVGYVNLWADGVKQTFNPGTTTAGINVGAIAGDPSTPANGDLWYDSTANELTARINGSNVAINEVPAWEVGSFTGTAAYSPDTLYVGTMTAAATLSFPTIGSGDKVGFVITATDADAADRTLTFPTASIMGSGSSGTTFVVPQNVDTFLEFIYDGTDMFLSQTHLMSAPVVSGVSTHSGTWLQTPAAMGALAVDITKANNTKTVAANATYTWSATPSTSGQEWGVVTKNSSGAEVTITHPTTKIDGQTGAASTSYTVPASGQRTVFFRYDGTDVIKYEGGGGVASLTPWTEDVDGGGFDLFDVVDITASGTISGYHAGDASGLIAIPASELSGQISDEVTYGVITTTEAGVLSPTDIAAGSGTITVDTSKAHTVVHLNATTETIALSGTPPHGTPVLVYIDAHTVDCVVTIDSVYSLNLQGLRTWFTVRADKNQIWQLWRTDTGWVSYDPLEMVDLPAAATPAITDLIETASPTTGASGKTTLAELRDTLGTTFNGTAASPNTDNPETVTFTRSTFYHYCGVTQELDLPAAAGYAGRGIVVRFDGSYVVTFDPNGSEVIDLNGTAMSAGEALIATGTAGQIALIVSDGTSWATSGGSAAYTQETP